CTSTSPPIPIPPTTPSWPRRHSGDGGGSCGLRHELDHLCNLVGGQRRPVARRDIAAHLHIALVELRLVHALEAQTARDAVHAWADAGEVERHLVATDVGFELDALEHRMRV